MIDLRKRLFSMLGRNQNLKKIDIVKHFTEILPRKARTYVSSIQQVFIEKVRRDRINAISV
jgi:hypothetical protein